MSIVYERSGAGTRGALLLDHGSNWDLRRRVVLVLNCMREKCQDNALTLPGFKMFSRHRTALRKIMIVGFGAFNFDWLHTLMPDPTLKYCGSGLNFKQSWVQNSIDELLEREVLQTLSKFPPCLIEPQKFMWIVVSYTKEFH